MNTPQRTEQDIINEAVEHVKSWNRQKFLLDDRIETLIKKRTQIDKEIHNAELELSRFVSGQPEWKLRLQEKISKALAKADIFNTHHHIL